MGCWGRSVTALAALACLALGFGAGPTFAQSAVKGNPVHGKAISYTCLGCHGIKGYRNAYPNYEVPKLKGQHPQYIVDALKEYKNGQERKFFTMHAQASALSLQDMKDIAVYFGEPVLKAGATKTATKPTPPKAAAVCVACHGADGVGIAPMYPSLAGQHADYIVRALTEYQTGLRTNPIMATMAKTLTESQKNIIAQYYSHLRPELHTLPRHYTFLSAER